MRQRLAGRPSTSAARRAPSVPRISPAPALVQRTCTECEEEERVQRKAISGTPPAIEATSVRPTGGGRALSAGERSFFEPRFGRDFGDVRLHQDGAAARSVQALAYTVGRDIVFASGLYDPASDAGRNLLAHELTHTIQQRSGAAAPAVMRTWDAPQSGDCTPAPDPKRWIDNIVVEQEEPQSVTVHWTDGTLESDQCSTGKGQCCVPPSTDGVTCSRERSRTKDTNCTPISETDGFPLINRVRDHNGVMFWSEIHHTRAIALHEYSPVDGTPLSHGCIRLNSAMAKKIFCNVSQNKTMVQVRGFARPRCDHPNLQAEWAADFATASRKPDGERAGEILEERKALQSAFGEKSFEKVAERIASGKKSFEGVDLADQAGRVKAGAAIQSLIPRCTSTAERPSVEEMRLFNTTPTPGKGSVPAQILNSSQFGQRLNPFLFALRAATSLATATKAVTTHGESLWKAATTRAQAATPDTDDRPLYWERLEMTRALRQWQPTAFTLSASDRATLIDTFEKTSRGMTTAAFTGLAEGTKRILISGFDPFGFFGTDRRNANPSGAAVLALDGQPVSSGSISGQVEGVVFPVRYRDFDAGMVETFFRPFLTSTPPVDMIMTISMGGRDPFQIEQFAGRNRLALSDNLNVPTTGTPATTLTDGPLAPPSSMPSGAQFTQTTLPAKAILGNLPKGSNVALDTSGTEVVSGANKETKIPSAGPTAGSTAVTGSGGNFLSNEIMYRTTLLRDTTKSGGRTIPVGHLHTPFLDLPTGTAISDATFTAARDTMVKTVKQIIEAALPAI